MLTINQLDRLKYIVMDDPGPLHFDDFGDELDLTKVIQDSMTAMDIVLKIEREFSIDLPLDIELTTFGELRREVERLIG